MKRLIILTLAVAMVTAASLPLDARPQDRRETPADFSEFLKAAKTKIELDADQERAMSELFRDYQKARKELVERYGSGDKDGQETLDMELMRLNRDAHSKVESILDLSQMKAFRELTREHRREVRESAHRERIDETVKMLGVTGENEAGVRAILEEQYEKMRVMMEGSRDGRGRRDEMRDAMEKIGRETEQKLEKVLSPGQMETYRKHIREQRDRMRGERPGRPGRGETGDHPVRRTGGGR
ncbi:MAG TPA: hypothetical protein VLA34_07400 [Candidatus Krumholzibacterium sp.]|nr:hypothetical protein [Candidatus Krumholzibacterium sp.]